MIFETSPVRPLLHPPSGVEITTHEFHTEDGVALVLTRVLAAPADDVVLLTHGLSSCSDIFMLPEHEGLVAYLLRHGYTDVWLLDWRGSCRYRYNEQGHPWTFDEVARFDLPAATAAVSHLVAGRRIHAVFHCAGALAASMAVAGGLCPELETLVCGSVSMFVRVPEIARIKALYAPELFRHVIGVDAVLSDFRKIGFFSRTAALAALAGITRRTECDNPSCHLLNFLWGSRASTLFAHANMHPAVHDRIVDYFGPAPVSFYEHIRKMVWAGAVVRYRTDDPRIDPLPENVLEHGFPAHLPVLLLTGDRNDLWLDSNETCYRLLHGRDPGSKVELALMPGYGHNDIFLGRNAAVDVFPRVLAFLDAHVRGRTLLRLDPRAAVLDAIARHLGVDVDDLDSSLSIASLGIDSVVAASILRELELSLGVELDADLILDTPTVDEFAQRIQACAGSKQAHV